MAYVTKIHKKCPASNVWVNQSLIQNFIGIKSKRNKHLIKIKIAMNHRCVTAKSHFFNISIFLIQIQDKNLCNFNWLLKSYGVFIKKLIACFLKYCFLQRPMIYVYAFFNTLVVDVWMRSSSFQIYLSTFLLQPCT